jgi:hypothetical protein
VWGGRGQVGQGLCASGCFASAEWVRQPGHSSSAGSFSNLPGGRFFVIMKLPVQPLASLSASRPVSTVILVRRAVLANAPPGRSYQRKRSSLQMTTLRTPFSNEQVGAGRFCRHRGCPRVTPRTHAVFLQGHRQQGVIFRRSCRTALPVSSPMMSQA